MLADTMKRLSDHQLTGMVEVMLSDDFSPADPSLDTYLAAYEEAKERGLIDDAADHGDS